MAKIRSTLDIVMERTKDLLPTEEQKTRLRCEEWSQKARGLLQRYLNGTLSVAAFRAEMGRGKEECPELEGFLKQAFIQELDPDGDSQRVATGLKEVLGLDPAPYIERLHAFAAKRAEQERVQGQRRITELMRMGVSGTAVVPNLEGDAHWLSLDTQLRAELRQELLAL